MKINKLHQQSRPPTLPIQRWGRNRRNLTLYAALGVLVGLCAVGLGLVLIWLEAAQPR